MKKKLKIQIVPSPRIDYCVDCGKEHGFDCPKDAMAKLGSFGGKATLKKYGRKHYVAMVKRRWAKAKKKPVDN